MHPSLQDSVYLQREQLACLLRAPLAALAERCAVAWHRPEELSAVLQAGFEKIPHRSILYCLGVDGVQICEDVGEQGPVVGRRGLNHGQFPYMQEPVPSWGFLLSDSYICVRNRRPSLTALQIVSVDQQPVGYVAADFDLRDLPVTTALYDEPVDWIQVKGDPSIRGALMWQSRVESPMDRNLERALPIVEELMTERGVFHCVIHFSSSQFTFWTLDDPYRYRILDQEALNDPDICLVYPCQAYPQDALIPLDDVARILKALRMLRMADENIYLRIATINIFNGMISLTFSCDGTHYMRHDQFLSKGMHFWFGSAA